LHHEPNWAKTKTSANYEDLDGDDDISFDDVDVGEDLKAFMSSPHCHHSTMLLLA
jgi:hypothetical protein